MNRGHNNIKLVIEKFKNMILNKVKQNSPI